MERPNGPSQEAEIENVPLIDLVRIVSRSTKVGISFLHPPQPIGGLPIKDNDLPSDAALLMWSEV